MVVKSDTRQPSSSKKPTKTQLDKKLALRLARVHLLITTMERRSSNEPEPFNESINELHLVVEQIAASSRAFNQSVDTFHQAARSRQVQYTEGPTSLKSVAKSIWESFAKAYFPRMLPYQVVYVIWARLRTQQAFPAPAHLFRANGPKALCHYHQSYQALLESFQLLLTVLQAIGFNCPPPATLLKRVRMVDKQVDEAFAQLTAAHQERLRLYDELSVRTGAIIEEIKQRHGSNNPTYLRIRYCVKADGIRLLFNLGSRMK